MIAAATAVLDAHGVEAVTIRRIAEELQVRPMSLYTHFRSKDELLAGVYDNLVAAIALPPVTEGLTAITSLLRAYYTVLVEHPELSRIRLDVEAYGPADVRLSEHLHTILSTHGVSGLEAIGTVAALVRFTLGAAAVHPARNAGPGAWPKAQRRVRRLPATEHPALPAFDQESPPFTQQELFEFGLNRILRPLGHH